MANSTQSAKYKGLIVYFVNDNFDDQHYNVLDEKKNESETEETAKKLRAEGDYEVQYYSNLTTDQIMKRMESVAKEDYGEEASLTCLIKSHSKNGDKALAKDGWYDISKLTEILDSNTSKWKGKPTQLLLKDYDDDEEEEVQEKEEDSDLVDGMVSKLVLGGFKKVIKIRGLNPGVAIIQKIIGNSSKKAPKDTKK